MVSSHSRTPSVGTQFIPATKSGSRLRAAIFGPSGSGKTFSALRIATGLGGRIAFIDTEHGSARKYASMFTFDVCELVDHRTETYRDAIHAAADHDVLVVDSMTHAWRQLLNEKDELDRGGKGNSWANWARITPKHAALIEDVLAFPGHVIATMRSKTDWQVSNEGGRIRPVRIGLAPDQRDGVEFEFDLLLELSADHVATVTKDRTNLVQDAIITRPDEAFGRRLAAWLNSNETIPVDAGESASRDAAGVDSRVRSAAPDGARY